MAIQSATKLEIYRAIETLSPEALAQVAGIVKNLQEKQKPAARLAGLWADIQFDIDDRTVRSLQRRVSRRSMRRRV